MGTEFKLAWRNLWRNKRRTLITVASIFIGVLLSACMTSMQEGSYTKMVDNVVQFYSGYIQVHNEEYWDNKTINNTFEYSDSLVNIIQKIPQVESVVPRLENFALASSEDITKGVMVLGISPENENKVTGLKGKLIAGDYLQQNDKGLLLSEMLAKFLKLSVNDTLVMIGQGYHGINAAGKYPVRGIIKHSSPELNKRMVYMELKNCQEYYSADNLVSSLVLMVEDQDAMKKAMHSLKKDILTPYSVMNWMDMQPEIVQAIQGDRAQGVVMKAILYVVIFFGILGTIMMMVAERYREFGVMVAVGMQKMRLSRILWFETLFIGLTGVFSGLIISIPALVFFHYNPIPFTGEIAEMMIKYGWEPFMFFSLIPKVFYNQILVIFVITMAVAIYPVIMAYRIQAMKAIRG